MKRAVFACCRGAFCLQSGWLVAYLVKRSVLSCWRGVFCLQADCMTLSPDLESPSLYIPADFQIARPHEDYWPNVYMGKLDVLQLAGDSLLPWWHDAAEVSL